MTLAERLASLEIGQGRANTKIITGKTCKGDNDSASAASIAAAYNGGGKTDWFLPSRKELDALCLEFFKGRIGDKVSIDTCKGSGIPIAVTGATNGTPWSFPKGNYWSSSEGGPDWSDTVAWLQVFLNGGHGELGKNGSHNVRPVRAF
jgi:hypothetical protein